MGNKQDTTEKAGTATHTKHRNNTRERNGRERKEGKRREGKGRAICVSCWYDVLFSVYLCVVLLCIVGGESAGLKTATTARGYKKAPSDFLYHHLDSHFYETEEQVSNKESGAHYEIHCSRKARP